MSTEPEDFRDKYNNGGLASNMSLLDLFAGQAMIVLLQESLAEEKQEEQELMETRIEDDYPLYREDPSEKARDLAREAYFRAFQMIYEKDYILTEWQYYVEQRKLEEEQTKTHNYKVYKIRKERREQKDLELVKQQKEREDAMERTKAFAMRIKAERISKNLGN